MFLLFVFNQSSETGPSSTEEFRHLPIFTSLSPQYLILDPLGEIPPNYRPIPDEVEARRAALYLGKEYWEDTPGDVNCADPPGAVFRAGMNDIYFNLYQGPPPTEYPNRVKVVYKQEDRNTSSSGSDVQELLGSTGLLYHAFGFNQGNKNNPFRYPKDILNHWSTELGGIYQQSFSLVHGMKDDILASPVGILIDPDDPSIFVHAFGSKDMFYGDAVKKYPISRPRIDQICQQRQGLAEALRLGFNAYNWRYTLYINGCYKYFLDTLMPEFSKHIFGEDGVRYFLGKPSRLLRDSYMLSHILQSHSLGRPRSRGKDECLECLWNDAIVSGPVERIIGVVLWADDPNTPVSMLNPSDKNGRSGFWFKQACESVKKINPEARCYHQIGDELIERPNGIPAELPTSMTMPQPFKYIIPKSPVSLPPEILPKVTDKDVAPEFRLSSFSGRFNFYHIGISYFFTLLLILLLWNLILNNVFYKKQFLDKYSLHEDDI